MKRSMVLALVILGWTNLGRAEMTPEQARKLYEKVSPAFVAVQYVWETELGRREIVGAGVIVNEEGLVMIPLSLVHPQIPDKQLKEFKVIVPSQAKDPEELDAEFVGRDERNNVAFVRAKEK